MDPQRDASMTKWTQNGHVTFKARVGCQMDVSSGQKWGPQIIAWLLTGDLWFEFTNRITGDFVDHFGTFP